MAEVPSAQGGTDPNYPVHSRNYEGFLKLLKYSIIVVAIVTVAVLYIISN